jgi:hypothetical protein
MPHQPPGPARPEPSEPRPPLPPAGGEPISIEPAELAKHLQWPLGLICSGTVDCPGTALNRTLASLETGRGCYHLLVTADQFTRQRRLWVAWLPREAPVLTMIDEQAEGQLDQALRAISRHLAEGQPE